MFTIFTSFLILLDLFFFSSVRVLQSSSEFWNTEGSFSGEYVLTLLKPSVLVLCLLFVLCHVCMCVCVCVCVSPVWHFFLHCRPTTDGVSMCFLSSRLPFPPSMFCSTPLCLFKERFHNILLRHPWGEIVRVQTPLETGNHQHPLIFTTVYLKAISETQQSAPQQCFLFKFLTRTDLFL